MRFPLIYADPAWTFETYSDEGKDRSPEQHYDCMSLDAIKAMPVADLAADDCACLLWACDPLLDKAFEVLTAWDFTFKTVGFYYIKVGRGLRPDTGMGYWTRANPEICLLGTRGKPSRLSKGVQRLILELSFEDKVVLAPRAAHSEKPHEVYSRIEKLLPGPYLELFARHARAGWHQWGNEVGKTGGVPNLIHMPGYPARAAAANDNSLFGATNEA
ncbi:MAG TPA: MT-A70 family methyltransferase [Rhodopseudomonas sp.]|uniref:MT-A70 family methyltransferase n=1 Tax=Rhodopseudomonas sp. TaxID=1078 RepID=UPI002EDAB858